MSKFFLVTIVVCMLAVTFAEPPSRYQQRQRFQRIQQARYQQQQQANRFRANTGAGRFFARQEAAPAQAPYLSAEDSKPAVPFEPESAVLPAQTYGPPAAPQQIYGAPESPTEPEFEPEPEAEEFTLSDESSSRLTMLNKKLLTGERLIQLPIQQAQLQPQQKLAKIVQVQTIQPAIQTAALIQPAGLLKTAFITTPAIAATTTTTAALTAAPAAALPPQNYYFVNQPFTYSAQLQAW